MEQADVDELVREFRKSARLHRVSAFLTFLLIGATIVSLVQVGRSMNTLNDNSAALEGSIDTTNDNSQNIRSSIASLKANTESLMSTASGLDANTNTLTTAVDSLDNNTDTLVQHVQSIDQNTVYIQESSGRIELNNTAIRLNTDSILESSRRLEENTSAVRDNTESILESSNRLEENTAGVRANTTGIIENTESIIANTQSLIELTEVIGIGNLDPSDEPDQPDPAGPIARITKGDPGPRRVGPGQGVACGATGPMCLLVDIELTNFSPGTYRVACTHDGWANFNYEVWSSFEVRVGASGSASSEGPCFINFARLYGNGVQLIVYRGDTEIARSNWLR